MLPFAEPAGTFNFFLPQVARRARADRNAPAPDGQHESLRHQLRPFPLSARQHLRHAGDDRRPLDVGKSDAATNCKAPTTRVSSLANGSLEPGPRANGNCTLTFIGDNVPLEEELRDALPPNMGRLWKSLKPRGAADLNVELAYDCAAAADERQAAAPGRAARPARSSRSIFPIAWRNSAARSTTRTARPSWRTSGGARLTSVSTEGTCDIEPDGGFRLRLVNLAVDRFKADHELIAALPEGLKRMVAELKPTGAINLRGNVEIRQDRGRRRAARSRPGTCTFDGPSGGARHGREIGKRLRPAEPGRRLTTASSFTRAGELDLDAATYKNFQFTEITGPAVDRQPIRSCWAWRPTLGRNPTRQPGNTRRHLTAKIFGGQVQADCQVDLGAAPQYTCRPR